jgi:MoxR-like ATPase
MTDPLSSLTDPAAALAVPSFTAAEIAAVDLDAVRAKFAANRQIIATRCLERGDVLHGANVALLGGEHVLLLGPPGTAKSYVARTWAGQFCVTYGEAMLTRQTAESDVFAYVDIPAMIAGRSVKRYEGKVTACQIAFVDEIFKGPQLLNSCLAWLNERIVPGPGALRSPLLSCIAASNECAEDDTVAAFDDRLLVRFWVDRIADRATRASLLTDAGANHGSAQGLTLQPISYLEILAAQTAVRSLTLDDVAANGLLDIQDALGQAGVYTSDRRTKAAARLLRAHAWLDGAAQVEVDHLDFLRNVLWRRPDDRPTVDAAIGAVNRGIIGEIRAGVERVLAWYGEQKARADFPSRAWEVASHIRAETIQLTSNWKDKVPERLKDRANGYFAELKTAFEEAKGLTEVAR